jgi:4-alpha-glucanotransferase
VWANPELFQLDDKREPTMVAGVPPDYFSPTGQLWGNPHYQWERMKQTGYAWWIARMKKTLEQVDLVRLDHFRGFEASWEIPAGQLTAEVGEWVKGPGADLFVTLKKALGGLPLLRSVELQRTQVTEAGVAELKRLLGCRQAAL